MSPVLHLVYKSNASSEMSHDEIQNIVKLSQFNNNKHGVTGLLIYRDGTFIQLLEGDEKKVRSLYEKISKDSRHENVEILIESKSGMRLTPKWAMNWVQERAGQNSTDSLFSLFGFILEKNKMDKSLILPLLTKFASY